MANLDAGSRGDIGDIMVVPVGVGIAICGSIHDAPFVVVVPVGVKGDLLFCGRSEIEERRQVFMNVCVRLLPPG